MKANSLAESQARKGGAQIGHVGVGRQIFSQTEADEMRIAEVEAEVCPGCECRLSRLSSNERGIYELEREQVRKIYYSIGRRICPQCRIIVSGRVGTALARVALSNELVVEVAEQHYVLGRTLGQIAERFSINYSTLADSLKRIGKLLEPSLERLKTDYRQSSVRHADAHRLARPSAATVTVGISVLKMSAFIYLEKPEARVWSEKCWERQS